MSVSDLKGPIPQLLLPVRVEIGAFVYLIDARGEIVGIIDTADQAMRLAEAANCYPVLVAALKELYDLLPDVDDDFLLDGAKGEFALKAIRVRGISAAVLKARQALALAESSGTT